MQIIIDYIKITLIDRYHYNKTLTGMESENVYLIHWNFIVKYEINSITFNNKCPSFFVL